jgi:hypothetical protein
LLYLPDRTEFLLRIDCVEGRLAVILPSRPPQNSVLYQGTTLVGP